MLGPVRGVRMRQALIVLLLSNVVASILVSPAGGLETRNPFQATPLGFALFTVFAFGLVLVVSALIRLFRGQPGAAGRAAAGTALFLPTVLADRAGVFHPLPAPPAIATVEYVVIVISILAIGVALGLRSAGRGVPRSAP